MSYSERIKAIQDEIKKKPVPPDDAYFGGKPPDNKVIPITAYERELLDGIDTSTTSGKLKRYQISCNVNIARYSIAMLEHQDDDAFTAHLNRLIISELAFVAGMARYLGITGDMPEGTPLHEPVRRDIGRVLVPHAGFMQGFYYAKGAE